MLNIPANFSNSNELGAIKETEVTERDTAIPNKVFLLSTEEVPEPAPEPEPGPEPDPDDPAGPSSGDGCDAGAGMAGLLILWAARKNMTR